MLWCVIAHGTLSQHSPTSASCSIPAADLSPSHQSLQPHAPVAPLLLQASASNFVPLWAGLHSGMGVGGQARVLQALQQSGLVHIAGVATTLESTGQQWVGGPHLLKPFFCGVSSASLIVHAFCAPRGCDWRWQDFPNAWPPLQHLIIMGLHSPDSSPEMQAYAVRLAAAGRWHDQPPQQAHARAHMHTHTPPGTAHDPTKLRSTASTRPTTSVSLPALPPPPPPPKKHP